MDGEGCSVSESSIKVRNIASIEKSSVFGAARKPKLDVSAHKIKQIPGFWLFSGSKVSNHASVVSGRPRSAELSGSKFAAFFKLFFYTESTFSNQTFKLNLRLTGNALTTNAECQNKRTKRISFLLSRLSFPSEINIQDE